MSARQLLLSFILTPALVTVLELAAMIVYDISRPPKGPRTVRQGGRDLLRNDQDTEESLR